MTKRGIVGGALLFAVVGCTDANDPDEGTVSDGKADGIAEFKLSLNRNSSGVQRAKESPKLPGAPSGTTKFTCDIDDRSVDGWRLLCERGKERLALTFGPDELEGAAIYAKTTSSPDSRSFYRCTATKHAPDEWPEELDCVAKHPKHIVNGQMISPFSSSIDIGIANSHLVAEDATGTKVFRGMKPFRTEDFEDLQQLGVGAVLMFKKPTTSTEVGKEQTALAPIGISGDNFLNIPFGFKDFAEFGEPCRQTVRGLAKLVEWSAAGKSTFLHCTVGEDRTGYLAGLYRLLVDTQGDPAAIFEQEMCERGYSSGNPQKPMAGVAREIDADLTPLFLKMVFKIQQGELTPASLDESVCDVDPETDPAFTDDSESFRCRVSTRYRL